MSILRIRWNLTAPPGQVVVVLTSPSSVMQYILLLHWLRQLRCFFIVLRTGFQCKCLRPLEEGFRVTNLFDPHRIWYHLRLLKFEGQSALFSSYLSLYRGLDHTEIRWIIAGQHGCGWIEAVQREWQYKCLVQDANPCSINTPNEKRIEEDVVKVKFLPESRSTHLWIRALSGKLDTCKL